MQGVVDELMKPWLSVPASYTPTCRAYPEPPPKGDARRAEASVSTLSETANLNTCIYVNLFTRPTFDLTLTALRQVDTCRVKLFRLD